MIIDCNTHPCSSGRWFNTPLDASISNLISQMDEANVEKSVIISFEDVNTFDFSYKAFKKYSDRIIPGMSFNPAAFNSPKIAVEKFKQLFEEWEGLIKMVKFHNRLHAFSLEDPRFLAVIEFNNNLIQPINVSICGLTMRPQYSISNIPPLIFSELAAKYSNTKFLIMHSGGTWLLQLYEAIRDLYNVYLDISFIQTRMRKSSIEADLTFLCWNFDRRLVWGSDFPEITLSQALSDFNIISGGLPEEKRRNILRSNIESVLL